MCVPVNRHLVLRTLRLETVRIEALFQIAQIVSDTGRKNGFTRVCKLSKCMANLGL